MYRTAEQIERDHERTIIAHRKQHATRHVRNATPPTPQLDRINPHVLYVWRRGAWVLLAFVRFAPTRKKMARWRTRYRVKATEIVRVKTLWEAQRNGPPLDDPRTTMVTVNMRKVEQQVRDLHIVQRAIVRGTPDMPMCSHGRRSKRPCKRKGTWLVGYNIGSDFKRRIISRCTEHAWGEQYLPTDAHHLMRVQRSTIN